MEEAQILKLCRTKVIVSDFTELLQSLKRLFYEKTAIFTDLIVLNVAIILLWHEKTTNNLR